MIKWNNLCFKAKPCAKPYIRKLVCRFTRKFWIIIWMWIQLTFIWKALRLDSLRNRGQRQLRNVVTRAVAKSGKLFHWPKPARRKWLISPCQNVVVCQTLEARPLYTKFDCPVACEKFPLLATACVWLWNWLTSQDILFPALGRVWLGVCRTVLKTPTLFRLKHTHIVYK